MLNFIFYHLGCERVSLIGPSSFMNHDVVLTVTVTLHWEGDETQASGAGLSNHSKSGIKFLDGKTYPDEETEVLHGQTPGSHDRPVASILSWRAQMGCRDCRRARSSVLLVLM